MAYVFLILAIYCIFISIRRFSGKKLPVYVAKDPDLSRGQIAFWGRNNGYSMLFWAGFSVTMSAWMLFGHWVILIPLVLLAVGGFFFSLRGSNALRNRTGKYDAPEDKKPGKGVAVRKKKRKKKKEK